MIRFSIDRWSAWAPGVEDADAWRSWARGERAVQGHAQPALATMNPMLRRRAGVPGRLALEPLLACDAHGVPVVFCSRHGEAIRSVELLKALAVEEPLSPTEFSLSVHNSVGGLYAIAGANNMPMTAIAGGGSSAVQGIIEACAQIDDGAEQVALVVYDAALPAPYSIYADETATAYGWTWVLSAPRSVHFELSWEPGSTVEDGEREPFGLELLRVFLREDRDAALGRDGVAWRWVRHG
jgi:Beta-ketoacyl synthase, N-terminal domain